MVNTSGTLRQYLKAPAKPDQKAPPTKPPIIIRQITTGPEPGACAPTYAANAAPTSICPSWPMFMRPTLVLIIVPTATIAIGTAEPSVLPHLPGFLKLPSKSAFHTSAQLAPTASTIIADSKSATKVLHAYRKTISLLLLIEEMASEIENNSYNSPLPISSPKFSLSAS